MICLIWFQIVLIAIIITFIILKIQGITLILTNFGTLSLELIKFIIKH